MPLRMCYNKEMEETALLSAQDSFTVKHSEQPATAMLGQNSVSSKLHLTPASGFLSLIAAASSFLPNHVKSLHNGKDVPRGSVAV